MRRTTAPEFVIISALMAASVAIFVYIVLAYINSAMPTEKCTIGPNGTTICVTN